MLKSLNCLRLRLMLCHVDRLPSCCCSFCRFYGVDRSIAYQRAATVVPPAIDQAPMLMLTLPSVQQDFVEWRQGRRYYAVWALDLDSPMLRQASRDICAVQPTYWLPDYVRASHLTVGLCGFPAAQARRDDDYPLARFIAQQKALSDAALAPFELEIGAPDSFTSAAYFSVRDLAGGIKKLRHFLGEADDSGFVPHVTFGLYREAVPLPGVLAESTQFHSRLSL